MEKGIDNFYTIVIILVIVSILYLLISYYFNKSENFTQSSINIPHAPATIIKSPVETVIPPIHEISPSGPNPPNARVSDSIARLNDNYDVIANDPLDENYGSQNIQDNLRYPERSFSPGIMNIGTKIITNSEIASNRILNSSQPLQPFKPEFIQSGGLLDGIGADDTKTDPNYASF